MTHAYTTHIVWTGNRGTGTHSQQGYDRTWDIAVPGKPVVHGSNDPLLGGDRSKLKPEDLLLSALSACHMLWYLQLAAETGLEVTAYKDEPVGFGETDAQGAGRFLSAVLRPHVSLRHGANLAEARRLHARIPGLCFVARSVNFPVSHEPSFTVVPHSNPLLLP